MTDLSTPTFINVIDFFLIFYTALNHLQMSDRKTRARTIGKHVPALTDYRHLTSAFFPVFNTSFQRLLLLLHFKKKIYIYIYIVMRHEMCRCDEIPKVTSLSRCVADRE